MKSKLGDKRSFKGIEWTATEELKTFDGRARGVLWIAGPIAGSVEEAWPRPSADNRYPFKSGSIHCQTFDKAALRAITSNLRDYETALKTIAAYEGTAEIYRKAARAIVEEARGR